VLRKLPFILGAKFFRKPLVIHVHAFSAESLFDETPFGLGRLVLSLADRVVALSESWREAMITRGKDLQIMVIANPVLVSSAKIGSRRSSTPIVLFAGKLESRKGYQDLLAAAAQILKKFPETKFWFAGHGDLAEASLLAEKLGIGNSIELMGWIDTQKMESLYHAANIFCLPSYQEGLPMVVLEAMGSGLPVVCTKVGGLPDYIEDGRNGLYAIPGNSISIADSITHLIAHPEEARIMGQRASDLIRERCSLSAVSHRLEELYENLLWRCKAKRLAIRPLR
jgi:glycosyltransferase involved in cell wall biosynthesis